MNLQTRVEISSQPFRLGVGSSVLVVGSCFAEVLGFRLGCALGDGMVYNNPCGVVYNPLSVARSVEILRSGEEFSYDSLVERDGLWHSMDFHGSFSSSDRDEVLGRINRSAVVSVDYIVLTLGTAFVYRYNGRVVSNCHKIPEREFERGRIGVEDVVGALERVSVCYPGARIIVSLSPIRHLRDGLVENSVSKSILRVAIDIFCNGDSKHRAYFPAYEIMQDELRDYRFTAVDMCHPTEQSRGYIWERFAGSFLSEELALLDRDAYRLYLSSQHRPLR